MLFKYFIYTVLYSPPFRSFGVVMNQGELDLQTLYNAIQTLYSDSKGISSNEKHAASAYLEEFQKSVGFNHSNHSLTNVTLLKCMKVIMLRIHILLVIGPSLDLG